jgi:hypothetical protein
MPKITGSQSVPKSMQAIYNAITALTDAFCRNHLSEDYRELAQRMTAACAGNGQAHSPQGSPAPGLAGSSTCSARSTFCRTRQPSPS